MKTNAPRLARLYGDFAFAWSMTGITVVRARSLGEAITKFDSLSRATMLNRTHYAFHRVPIELNPEAEERQ